MATTVLEVLIRARDDTKQALDGVSTRLSGIGRSAQKAGLGMTAGFTVPLVAAGVASVSAASDLVEAQNKAVVIFGESAKAVARFADTAAVSYGVSKRAALEYAGSVGTIFRGSGFAEEASAGLSLEIVKLAADLGSINNIPYDVALDKLKSGLVGQSRPLRDIGVLLNETDVALHAVTIGLAEEGEELSESQKLLARYSLIMEKTKLQQGDFGNTSEDLANSQKILGARFEDLRASIGGALLPVALKLVQWGNRMVTVGERLNATFQALSPRMKVIVGVGLLILISLGPLLLVFGTMLIAISFMIPALAGLAGAFLLLLGPVGLVILAILGLIALGVLIAVFWDDIRAGAIRFGEIMLSLPGEVGKAMIDMANVAIEAVVAMGTGMVEVAVKIANKMIEVLSFWNFFGSTMIDVYRREGSEAGDALMLGMVKSITAKSNAVVGAVAEPLQEMRAIVRDLISELDRLAGLPTVESSAEDIRLAKLRLEILKLEAAALDEKAQRGARVAAIADALADKEAQLALVQSDLSFLTGDVAAQFRDMEAALIAEIDQLEAEREAVEDALGPAERAIEAKRDEIKELEFLADLRSAERDLIVARGKAQDKTLLSDLEVIQALKDMAPAIAAVTDELVIQESNLQGQFIPAWGNALTAIETTATEGSTAIGTAATDMAINLENISDDLLGLGIDFGNLETQLDDMELVNPFEGLNNFMAETGRKWNNLRSTLSSGGFFVDVAAGFSTGGVGGAVAAAIGAIVEGQRDSRETGQGGFQAGGLIPGATGAPVPIVAHGGETVLTQTQTESLMKALGGGAGVAGGAPGGAGGTTYVTVHNLTVRSDDLRETLRTVGVQVPGT